MELYQEASSKTGLSIEAVKRIEELVLKKGNFSRERIHNGLYTFFCKIGMVRYYFITTPVETIAKHIESILAAEVIAINRDSSQLDVEFVSEQQDSAMYLVNDQHDKAVEIERRVSERQMPRAAAEVATNARQDVAGDRGRFRVAGLLRPRGKPTTGQTDRASNLDHCG